jgi:nicotinamide mononucleotide adenylyltransferase
MCLKDCVNDEELLKEISRRVDQKRITWNICYHYDSSKTKAEFTATEQKYILSFSVDTNIDRNYTCRQVYKQLEPVLLNAKEKQAEKEQKASKNELDKVFEAMKERQKKNNS